MVNFGQLSLRFNRGMKTRPETAKMGLSGVFIAAGNWARIAFAVEIKHYDLYELLLTSYDC